MFLSLTLLLYPPNSTQLDTYLGRDKSKPWTPPALTVNDVSDLTEQSLKSPTQIPPGPVEEESEEESEGEE